MTNLLASATEKPRVLASAQHPALAQAAVIVNALKFSPLGLTRLQTRVDGAFSTLGWLPPIWLQTTAETRGADEARAARHAGVDIVLVAGGDGTIRTVGEVLAGSDIPLALLPMGTGNLLARNLGIPRRDVEAAVIVAATGTDNRIDVGWLELDRFGDGVETERHAFLVMAGSGYDAAMMAGVDHTMKSRLGPAAYLVSGTRAIRRPMSSTVITVDGRSRREELSRGVVVGNFGALIMGLTLMPEADSADGVLDGVIFHQRTVFDWMRVAFSVVSRRRGIRMMPRLRGRSIEVRTDIPQLVEVDGDVIGEARLIRFDVQPGGLIVRGPRASRSTVTR